MKKGFTLMEILIAIAIIAVLTAVGIVSYVSINRNARDAKRRGDIEQIRSALEMFRSDKGSYPAVGDLGWTDASNLNTGDSDTGLVDTYIPAIPSDPQSTNFVYRYRGINNYYGYCLEANVENTATATDTCGAAGSIETGYNYGTKNP
jgi:general secretion pathway protein G